MLQPAEPKHVRAVARLHAESIPYGFLSQLGPWFLQELYGSVAQEPGTIVFVATDESGRCLGFIAGTIDTRGLFQRVLVRRWLPFAVAGVASLGSLSNLRRAFETVLYGLRGRSAQVGANVSAEVLALAVDSKSRGAGIGRALVLGLENFFREQSISTYKVVTHAADETSNAFYRSCGFQSERSFKHHENIMNEYVKRL
jgi:ribosomal protein S18 acetylase RimI-like enzyme